MNDAPLNPSALPPLPRPGYKDRCGWLIAFGIIEILIACFFLFMCAFMALVIPNIPKQPGQPDVPSAIFLLGAGFYGVLAAIFATAGIGSMQAKNWARILMIVLSSIWLAFGALGTLSAALMMPMILRQQEAILSQNPAMQQGQLPPNFMTVVMTITIIFQVLIMIVLPLIFLIFYTRKSVKATCEARWAPASPALAAITSSGVMTGAPAPVSAAKGLPVPIVIAIVCFLLFGLSRLVTLWLPITLLFGVTLRGTAARVVIGVLGAIDLYCVWSFYKLRIQGWWVAIGAFLFMLASGITTLVRVDLKSFYDEVYQQMGMNPEQVSPYAIGFEPKAMHFFMAMGWLVWAAVLVLLIYTKRYFPRIASGQ